jgi:hypothetical protein
MHVAVTALAAVAVALKGTAPGICDGARLNAF